jgi:hypothetical protein
MDAFTSLNSDVLVIRNFFKVSLQISVCMYQLTKMINAIIKKNPYLLFSGLILMSIILMMRADMTTTNEQQRARVPATKNRVDKLRRHSISAILTSCISVAIT